MATIRTFIGTAALVLIGAGAFAQGVPSNMQGAMQRMMPAQADAPATKDFKGSSYENDDGGA